MVLLIIAAMVVALSVICILWLLSRLDRLQRSRTGSLFVRRWSYILRADSYSEPGHALLPWLRFLLGVLAVSVIVTLTTLLLLVPR